MRWPAATLGLGRRGWLDILQVGRRDALDVDHVLQLALLKARAQLGVIPISAITEDDRRRDPPGDQLVDHLQRQAPLLHVVGILWQLGLRASLPVELAVLIPLLRDEQPPVNRTRRLITRRVDRHPDLAVPDLPQRPGVLPR